ncbi:MAG: PD40 domain-containing protein [Bacteroidales bacterium]|nr:PD40 domain-containing protein [Bacteroidales bacterium]
MSTPLVKIHLFSFNKIISVRRLRFLFQLFLLTILTANVAAQSKKELKEIFTQAESYYLYEEYDLANQLYLLLENPENLNIAYKIGTCYLNIPDEKEKAIPYLEAAVKSASFNAKPASFKETRAPLDAYFFLAKAYMINNELEKGLSTLRTFSKLAGEIDDKGKKGIQNLEFIDQQIEAINNAIRFQGNPAMISRKLLGKEFSEGSMNENPAVSYDGNTLVYTERRGMVNIILFSKKIRGKWQTPIDITSQLNAGEDCSSCSLNHDGTKLFLYKTDNFDGNIYSSDYVNGSWTPIVKLNRNINTKYYESHASISSDNKRLYFTSNREGGTGGLDIYVSEKDASGDWGFPINLGTSVNTPYNEDNPFITADGSTLFFSSEGHNSMGGYDNFKSSFTSDGWDTPQNLGFPVNTTDDNKFLQPFNNGMNAFYSMKTDYKRRDIFYIGLEGPDVNEIFEISGQFMLNDTALSASRNFSIHILNNISGDVVGASTPDVKTGFYSVHVTPGNYKLVYSGDGYFSNIIDTALTQENLNLIVNLDITLIRDSSLVPVRYDRINLDDIPVVAAIDSSILIRNMRVDDVTDQDEVDSDILYYTVQVMALYNPVDISYFKHITDMRVMYNEADKFYRYTTGRFGTREEALALLIELRRKGYPDDIFIKKVSKQ